MKKWDNIRQGMPVYGPDNKVIGTIDRIEGDTYYINGHQVPSSMISRADNRGVYLSGTSMRSDSAENDISIPVAEERLNVGKRETDLGEVQVNKRVRQEQQNVPVDLRREQVNVERNDVEHRTLSPEEARNAFQEGTIRMPVRGEEAVVNKEAVVTDEVHLHKNQTTERRNISDTVRKEEVELGGNYQTTQNRTTGDSQYDRSSAATPQYRSAQPQTGMNAGTGSSRNLGKQVRQGTEVFGNDDDLVGRVKEISGDSILIDRSMARDVYVPLSAVDNVSSDGVILNLPADEVDNQGWENPPIFGSDTDATGY